MTIPSLVAAQVHTIFNPPQAARPQPPVDTSSAAQASDQPQQSRAQEARQSVNLLV